MNSSISQRFDLRAAKYDNRLTAYIGERELRQIRQLVPPHSKVLDYGCGTGRTTLDLLKRRCAVTAYDISHEMLARAQGKIRRFGLVANFITEPSELKGQTWPIITCIGVLDYYPDPLPLLDTLHQYLDPDGHLIITYPNALSPLAWLYAFGSRWTIPVNLRTPGSSRHTAQQAGFHINTLLFAFPSLAPIGHTIIMSMSPIVALHNPKTT